MLSDYRAWLLSELKLLGNASHHAYSFGQANMAQRAIERLDEETAKTVFVGLAPEAARSALAALPPEPALDDLRIALEAAVAPLTP